MTRLALLILFSLGFSIALQAQGAFDGYMKGKGNTDFAFTYSYERYNTYFFGREPRDVSVTTQTVSLYVTGGLKENLDFVVSIPYIRTDSLNRSLQDGILGLKYQNFQHTGSEGTFSLLTIVGASFPLSAYPTDTDRPIGERAGVFLARLAGQYQHSSGFFLMGQAGFDFRLFPQSQFAIPIVLRTGYAGKSFYVDAWLDLFNTLNEGMNQRIGEGQGAVWTKAGGTFYKPIHRRFGLFAGGAYILSGRNIGKAYRFNIGIVVR